MNTNVTTAIGAAQVQSLAYHMTALMLVPTGSFIHGHGTLFIRFARLPVAAYQLFIGYQGCFRGKMALTCAT